MAAWAWQEERGAWTTYDAAVSRALEDAYVSGKRSVTLKAGRVTHAVNFVEMTVTLDSMKKPLRIKQISPSSGATPTPSKLTEVHQLFDKCRAAGSGSGSPADSRDAIQGHGFITLSEELGVDVQDLVMLYLAFKAEAKTPYQISRSEWYRLVAVLNVDTIKKLKTLLPSLRRQVHPSSGGEFKALYEFTFAFVRDDEAHSCVPVETATAYWRLLLGSTWALCEPWCDFLAQHSKRTVSRDVWRQVLEFTHVVSFDDYDVQSSAWPTVMDEFVEHMRGRAATTKAPVVWC